MTLVTGLDVYFDGRKKVLEVYDEPFHSHPLRIVFATIDRGKRINPVVLQTATSYDPESKSRKEAYESARHWINLAGYGQNILPVENGEPVTRRPLFRDVLPLVELD